jgi:hypothetical protein
VNLVLRYEARPYRQPQVKKRNPIFASEAAIFVWKTRKTYLPRQARDKLNVRFYI